MSLYGNVEQYAETRQRRSGILKSLYDPDVWSVRGGHSNSKYSEGYHSATTGAGNERQEGRDLTTGASSRARAQLAEKPRNSQAEPQDAASAAAASTRAVPAGAEAEEVARPNLLLHPVREYRFLWPTSPAHCQQFRGQVTSRLRSAARTTGGVTTLTS